jgi:predicted transcriptional regulator of viral defense system
VTAPDIAYVLEMRDDTARQYLWRLCKRGLNVRLSTGVYAPVTQSQMSQGDDDVVRTSSEDQAA